MARLNILKLSHLAEALRPRTHEGAPARLLTPELQLRRSVLTCLLWEDQFYEDGVEIAGRIKELIPKVSAEKNGVGYGRWTHIDGWSESVIEYIRALEQMPQA